MASPYSKSSQQLFWDLVNKSNPQLKIPLSDDNCVIYGYPVSQTASAANGMRNTRIRLYAKQGKGYKGDITVNYNRLSLGGLFTGYVPTVTNYTANDAASVLAAFNAAYGTKMVYAGRQTGSTQPAWTIGMTIPDITPASTYSTGSQYSDNTMLFTAAAESLCWIGSVTISRVRGNPDLGTLITTPELQTSRRIVTAPDGKYNVPLLTWGVDFTEQIAIIKAFIAAPTQRTPQLNLSNMLRQVTGLPFSWNNSNTPLDKLDLYNFTNNALSGAIGSRNYYNSEDYNRCLVLYNPTPIGEGWIVPNGYMVYPFSQQDEVGYAAAVTVNTGVFIHYNE